MRDGSFTQPSEPARVIDQTESSEWARTKMPERLIDELVKQGLLSEDSGREVLERQVIQGGALDSAILEAYPMSEAALLSAVVRAYGGAAALPEETRLPPDEGALFALPEQWARRYCLAPLELDRMKRVLRVLSPAPLDSRLIDRLGELLELRISPCLALEFRVHERLSMLYGARPPERFVALIEQAQGAMPVPRASSATSRAGLDAQRRLTFGGAVNLLREATEREDIVRTALSYATRDLQFAAMLIVHKTHLEGWMAAGEGSHRIPGVRLELAPESAFRVVLDAPNHYLGPVPEDHVHEEFIAAIGRPRPRAVLILPVRVKNRTVALIYAENGPSPIQSQTASDLMLFMTHVQNSLEILLLRRKAQSLSNIGGTPSAVEFSGTADIMKHLVPSTLGRTASESIPPPMAPPSSAGSTTASTTVSATEENPSQASQARAPEPRMGSSARTSRLIAEFEERTTLRDTLESLERIDTKGSTPMVVDFRSQADADGWEPVTVEAWDDTHGNEPIYGAPSLLPEQPASDLARPEEGGSRAASPAAGATDRDRVSTQLPDEEPVPLTKTTRPGRLAQPEEVSALSHVEVTVAAPEWEEVKADSLSASGFTEQAPSEAGQPAVDTIPDGPFAAIDGHIAELSGPDAGLRKAAIAALEALGSVVIGPLMRHFPGPLRVDPFAEDLPKFERCGELLRLVARLGRSAHPHVARFLDASTPAHRLLAAHFYKSVRVPEVVPRLAQRLHDEESRVSMVAASALMEYRDVDEFASVLSRLHDRLGASAVTARKHAAFLLGFFRDTTAVPLLIGILERKEWAMFDSVEQALGEITKQGFGSNAKKWRAWWTKNKDRPRALWLIDGLSSKEDWLRRSAYEELCALAGTDFGFDDNASKRDRDAATARIRAWWAEHGSQSAHR